MTLREAHLLSPYRPPTNYPVSIAADEAESWLSGYFSLWHPAILAGLANPPTISNTYDHDRPTPEFIYALPSGPHLHQPTDWREQVRDLGAIAYTACASESETQANLKSAFAQAGLADHLLEATAPVVLLFRAVGFGYLLVDFLYEAMDHQRLLDIPAFWADVQSAVEAINRPEGDNEIRRHLTDAVEKLAVARETLTSNTLRLFDFVLPQDDRFDITWPATMSAGLPVAVVTSAEWLESLQKSSPERFAELRSVVRNSTSTQTTPGVDLCVGSFRERDDALLPAESQWWNLRRARAAVNDLLGTPPTIYGRQISALHQQLPSWLRHAGYRAAMLVAFDGAQSPARNSTVLNWPAPDGQSLDAFGRTPLDAADPLTFFNLVYSLQQAISQDATPAVAFRHADATPSIGYAELVTLAQLGPAIGEWTGLNGFLAEQHYGDYLGNTTADDYFTDTLDDRVTRRKLQDPVSGFASHLRARRRLESAYALAALHRTLTPPTESDHESVRALDELEDMIELHGADLDEREQAATRLVETEAEWAKKLAERIQSRSTENQPGWLVFNPCGFTRRVALEIADFGDPIPVQDVVKSAEFSGGSAKLVVEVPALGYAWFPKSNTPSTPPRSRIQTAENTLVRNEFLEAEFDPVTGALRAFRDLRTRVNRLGMQLVYQPGSKTRARKITVTHSGAALGEVVCEGDVVDEHDAVLAAFRTRLRAWVGRPALEVRIELDPVRLPVGYPWHAYYGARFAWRDERAAIFRGANGTNSRSTTMRPISPDYIEVRLGAERTFVFTGGLPFIQKHAGRMADIVLIPEGETCRSFDLLLACDRDYPMQTAVGWTTPAPVVATTKGPPPSGTSGWLGHVDLPSLVLSSLRPCPPGEGMNRAVAARFLECSGFAGSTEVRFARDTDRASRLDNDGVAGDQLPVVAGAIPVDFSAEEVFRIRAEWI